MKESSRNHGIDSLRAIAIMLVLGLHYFGYLHDVGHEATGLAHVIGKSFGHGYYGVTMFFVISGFLITTTSVNYVDRSRNRVGVPLYPFYVRRISRIFPLLSLSIALGALVLSLGLERSAAWINIYHLPNARFNPAFWISIATFSFNWVRIASSHLSDGWGMHWDVLWSLAVEEQFYLLFPLTILMLGELRKIRVVLLLCIAGSLGCRAMLLLDGHTWLQAFTNSLSCMDALAIGCLTAFAAPLAKSRIHIAAAAGLVLVVATYLIGYRPVAGVMTTGLAVGTSLLIQAARSSNPRKRALSAAFGYVGQLSFGLYLLHPLVLFLLAPLVAHVSPLIGFGMFIAACIVLAHISFFLFERPVERYLRKRMLGRPSEHTSMVIPREQTAA